MPRSAGARQPRQGFTAVELLVVTLIMGFLAAVLFQVSRSFFQQYLKMENAMAITSEVGFFFSTLGEDVLTACGDPDNIDELFTIEDDGSGSWKLSFVRFSVGKAEPIEYRQAGNEIIRTCAAKSTTFRFSGQVILETLKIGGPFLSSDDRGNRVWLEVVMLIKTNTLGNVVAGNQIRLARNFFPTFFNRSLNTKWIDNSPHAITK